MRCIDLDLTKQSLDFIAEKRSDYLFLDSGFGRFNYIELIDGSFILDTYRGYVDYLVDQSIIPPPPPSL